MINKFNDITHDSNPEVLEQCCFDKFNCKCITPENLTSFDNFPFSLLHLNTRSLVKHYDDLLSLLASMDHMFNIIGCSETWINERASTNTLNLDGYVLYNKNRTGRPGGGVCVYANVQHSVTVRDDLYIDDGLSDSIFLELNVENKKI